MEYSSAEEFVINVITWGDLGIIVLLFAIFIAILAVVSNTAKLVRVWEDYNEFIANQKKVF